MQSTRESCKPKRCAKRRNSRKKSLSPSDLKRARDSKSEKLGKRSLSEGSVKVKHRKSNIRRSLTHPFTHADYTDVPLCQPVHSDAENTVKVQLESDESNLPPTSSDRDTEDDVRQRHLFKPRWDSGSEMDSIISIVRRVSARRRRTSQAEWGINRSPETIEAGEVSEREAGRMRPDDYRLVFLSSDSSYRDDTEDTASTASSAAAPAHDDCDWDYFEPGAAAAGASTPAARVPPRPTPQPPSQSSPPCTRPCSCGAEPRIVAVPVPVPVPVPAALWPALLAFPDGSGREPPPPPHWSTYPGFPQLDAAALARLTKAAATAAAGVAATLPRTGMPTVDTIDKAIQSEAIEPIVERGDNADSVLADNKQTDNDSEKRAVEPNLSDEIKIVAEIETPAVFENVEAMPDHLEAEKAFASSDDSAESSEDEEGGVCRSYDFRSGAPDEPATSDEDSEDSGGGGGGRFSRVFVVNPADSSSDVEDNADSSGIDCDDGDDKKSDSLEMIAIEVLPDRGRPDVEVDENLGNMNVLRTENTSDRHSIIPYGSEPHEDNGSVKCVEFVQFCDPSLFQNGVNIENHGNRAPDNPDSVKIFGHLESESNGNINDFHMCSQENSFSSDSSSSSDESKVKANEEKSNRSDDKTPIIFNDVTYDNTKSGIPSSTSELAEPKISLGKIDLLKGIERKLSELLKKESLEEQLEEKPQAATAGHVYEGEERGGGGGAPAATAAVDRSRPAHADGSARYTSRVMITHDRVSVVTTDTTRLMRDVTVHHTNSQSEPGVERTERDDDDERLSDDGLQRPGDGVGAGVTVVSNSDTLSAVVCLEEGLADDDSWVEDVSHDEDARTSPTDSDSGDEAAIGARGDDFVGYCRPSLDFTLHTIVEESCEESEAEHDAKKPRPISATELEKYFFFGLGDGRHARDDDREASDTSSVCSEGGESLVDNEQPEGTGETDDLVSSRLEKYFLSGFMGFNQERRDSDGSGSVGSDSEGRQSPEHRRKRLVLRARGTPRSHSSSLDNLLTGEELAQEPPEVSDGSSTETEDRHDCCSERVDLQSENKRKKQNKKTRGSPADERRLSTEFAEENRDDTRSVSEGEDGRSTPRPEFPPLGSELSESKKQTSRDSGFVGSCDDLLRNGDSSGDFSRTHEPKMELEEITEEIRPEIEERTEGPPPRLLPGALSRKDSFNNWSSDEETNLMMTKMRQFFKQMIASGNVRTSTPSSASSAAGGSAEGRPPKPPQLLYFESELTRLMKTVPGIRDEEVREIVEYLSSEDTWSDSYDSSDYAGSDLEGAVGGRSELRRQISESCREIIDEFDRGGVGNAGGARSLERDAAGAYRRLAATLGRAGEGSPPLFGKVMRHIGGRLVALMHEVSAAASPSTDDDSASEPGALARSKSHDVLEAAASRASVASDSERFSWRGSFESALVAADSRGTLGAPEVRRSPPADLAAQRSHSRSCGAIATSEERLWRARRRSSAPDAESEEEQARAGSLPRLPSVAGSSACVAGPVKSARYRAPGFRTAIRAASAPGLHAPRRRRPMSAQPHVATPAAPASAPSLQDEVYISEGLSPGHATLPRRSSSPIPHDADRDRFSFNKSGLQARSESMASVYSGAGEGARGSVTVRGEVQFSLLYNYRLGALEVGVKRCRDLAPVDTKRSRSDPYVKVYLLPDKSKAGKRKTKVKKNTLNPEFEETLRFVQPLPSLSSRTLWLSVWHADMFGRNDFLGEVTLPLTDVVFDDATPMWYKLQERTEQFEEPPGSRGDLIIALKFEIQEGGNSTPSRGKGTLHVLVKEAKNLVATKPNGFDLFCKSYLLPERGRLAKQKTSVCRRTLNPRWEHTFMYRGVTLAELSTRALELSLWDRDRLASNDFMGAVRLSLGSGMYMGASVNWMDSVGKEVTLWQTMMQRPNFWVEGSLPLRSQLSN